MRASASAEDWEEHPDRPAMMFSAMQFETRQMKPRPWLVPDMIPGRQVTSGDGVGGGGKSTILGLQLPVCVVTGRAWLGMEVTRGPAIYLASEDDEEEIHRRLDAVCVHYGVGFRDLADLHVWPLAAEDPALVIPGRDDTIEPTLRWRQLEAAVDWINPVLLVLDSKADVFGGNEVSRAQARGFVGMLRKLAMRSGAAIVLLGHPSLTGISSGSGSSGSTHWRNAVRSGLHLRRPDDPDAHPDMRVLEVVKANYSTCGKQITLRWSAGVFEPVEGVQHADRQEAADHVDATFLRLLTAFCQEGRRVSHSTGANYAPAVFAKDPRAGGIRSSGFTTAMMRLLAAGKVKVESVGPPSRRLQQLVVAGGE